MGDLKLELKGIEVVNAIMKSLPDAVNKKILQDVSRKGGAIVANELKQSTPDGISNKKSKNKLSNQVTVANSSSGQGALVGFKRSGFVAKFIDGGTRERKTTKGFNRGSMKAKPFISSAYDRAVPKVVSFMNDNFLNIINSSLKKQIKKIK